MFEAYLEVLEESYSEVTLAFEGLADENVWKRPAAGLLSIGELAGHIAYWEAVRLAGDGGEDPEHGLEKCAVSSPLIDPRFRYYTTNLPAPPTEAQRAMTAPQVCGELVRVHTESVAAFQAQYPHWNTDAPGWPPDADYAMFLKYGAFHVAYHTGQMYSVRHLLGDVPPSN